MKYPFFILLGLIALAVPAQADDKSWQFVLSVGGMAVDQPVAGPDGWILPVRVDVSGLTANTTAPSVMNSGIGCDHVESKIVNDGIYLTLVTSSTVAQKNARCTQAALGKIAPGHYTVYYLGPNEDPNRLTDITIKE